MCILRTHAAFWSHQWSPISLKVLKAEIPEASFEKNGPNDEDV